MSSSLVVRHGDFSERPPTASTHCKTVVLFSSRIQDAWHETLQFCKPLSIRILVSQEDESSIFFIKHLLSALWSHRVKFGRVRKIVLISSQLWFKDNQASIVMASHSNVSLAGNSQCPSMLRHRLCSIPE